MDITGTGNFHFGKWPARMDMALDMYESVMAQIPLAKSTSKDSQSQVVKILEKENTIGVFVWLYDDLELPEWWKDAKVIYEYVQPHEKA